MDLNVTDQEMEQMTIPELNRLLPCLSGEQYKKAKFYIIQKHIDNKEKKKDLTFSTLGEKVQTGSVD